VRGVADTLAAAWTTFNTVSAMGEVLFGQGKRAEAEPILSAGHHGMKAREASIEPNGRPRLTQSLERLVGFYEATGTESEAAAWRTKLEEQRKSEKGG
jgi:hypothetical protein